MAPWGQATIGWLSTILPIPAHLQLKPPVTLSGVNIVKNDDKTYSFMGELNTAGGVTLAADVNYASGKWHFCDIRFSDGRSKAAISGRQTDGGFEMTFAGNVEKETADRLLKDNRVLSGSLAGNFFGNHRRGKHPSSRLFPECFRERAYTFSPGGSIVWTSIIFP